MAKAKENAPHFKVKYPLSRPGKKDQWITIGAAWKKGSMVSVQLNALPLSNFNGTLHLYPVKD